MPDGIFYFSLFNFSETEQDVFFVQREDPVGIRPVAGGADAAGVEKVKPVFRNVFLVAAVRMPEQRDIRASRPCRRDQSAHAAFDPVRVAVREKDPMPANLKDALPRIRTVDRKIAVAAHGKISAIREFFTQADKRRHPVAEEKDSLARRMRGNDLLGTPPPRVNIREHQNTFHKILRKTAQPHTPPHILQSKAYFKEDFAVKIDQNTLRALAAMDDVTLTQTIKTLAAAGGFALDPAALTHENLELLRTSLCGATDADLARAKEILGGKGV